MIMALVACGHDVGSARQRSPRATRPMRKLKSRADSGGHERTDSSDPVFARSRDLWVVVPRYAPDECEPWG
jgi:hypothetical protein